MLTHLTDMMVWSIHGKIDNDKTIEMLSKMAFNFAKSGVDIVAPSDMMDGRIKLIRSYLEKNKYQGYLHIIIFIKFCSNFYTPFRQVLGSEKNLVTVPKVLTR